MENYSLTEYESCLRQGTNNHAGIIYVRRCFPRLRTGCRCRTSQTPNDIKWNGQNSTLKCWLLGMAGNLVNWRERVKEDENGKGFKERSISHKRSVSRRIRGGVSKQLSNPRALHLLHMKIRHWEELGPLDSLTLRLWQQIVMLEITRSGCGDETLK